MQYDLYRRLRLQFLVLLMMGAVTPETCRVTLQWNKSDCILLHLVGLLFSVNYDAWNHELKNSVLSCSSHRCSHCCRWLNSLSQTLPLCHFITTIKIVATSRQGLCQCNVLGYDGGYLSWVIHESYFFFFPDWVCHCGICRLKCSGHWVAWLQHRETRLLSKDK